MILGRLVAFALLVLPWSSARADTLRLAVVAGNDTGSAARPVLRYAERDAEKMARALREAALAETVLLKGGDAAGIRDALKHVRRRIKKFKKSPADRVLLLFYYSGHSDGAVLETGARAHLSFQELRRRLERAQADVTIAMIDACYSGGAIQQRGIKVIDPFEVRLNNELESTGFAALTSSSANETTIETDAIEGGYFTHHLVSGLRGGADASGDSVVTLSELYAYAYHHTVYSTSMILTGAHHPSYEINLTGKGDLALVNLERATSQLIIPGGTRVSVRRVAGERVVAEVDEDAPRRLVLGPGDYELAIANDRRLGTARVSLRDGVTVRLAESDIQYTSAASIAMRGLSDAGGLQQLLDDSQTMFRLSLGWAPPIASDLDNAASFGLELDALSIASFGIYGGYATSGPAVERQAGLLAGLHASFESRYHALSVGGRVRGGFLWQDGARSGWSSLFALGPTARYRFLGTEFLDAVFVAVSAEAVTARLIESETPAWRLLFRPTVALGVAFGI
ncbi:MAG: caspase family protein [Myxococcota bacterium]